MLVLTRRIGEEIVIADDIHVRVVAVKGRRVCLGIEAPSAIRVERLELLADRCEGVAPPTVGTNAEEHRAAGKRS
jgi:carbon storage regulator CsrA